MADLSMSRLVMKRSGQVGSMAAVLIRRGGKMVWPSVDVAGRMSLDAVDYMYM